MTKQVYVFWLVGTSSIFSMLKSVFEKLVKNPPPVTVTARRHRPKAAPRISHSPVPVVVPLRLSVLEYGVIRLFLVVLAQRASSQTEKRGQTATSRTQADRNELI